MATIDLRRSHSIGKEKAREAAESIAAQLKNKLDVTYRWDGDQLKFQRKGADGAIHVSDNEVRFEANLAFLLRPLKGIIENEVKEYFDKYLGGGKRA